MRTGPLLLCLVAAFGANVRASGPVTIDDPKDKQIVEAFLRHVDAVPGRLTEAYAKKQAADSAESYSWIVLKYQRMPLVAYKVTGDVKYLDMFVRCFKNLRAAMTKGPDGYLGWYGKPLKLFRNPGKPDQAVDVIITSYRAVIVLSEFVEAAGADPALKAKYAAERAAYIDLMENHLVRKWDARGCYVDLGRGGAVFRTPKTLRKTKAHLTQPHNKHSIIIRGLLGLYRVTGTDAHMRKAVKLGVRFKRSLTLTGGHYEWNYWDPAGAWDVHPDEESKWKHWIGVEHKGGYYASTLSQAVALYHHGVVFDRADIDRFLQTQMTMCWNADPASPRWARVDGSRSRKYMKGAYMCSALAPFESKIADFCYGARSQANRIAKANHGWQGGVVAAGWIGAKFSRPSPARGGRPLHGKAGQMFRAKADNRALLAELDFTVSGSGYRPPRTPSQMKNMPQGPATQGGEDRAGQTMASPYAKWSHGLPTDPDFFPLTVWGQSPKNAAKYKKAGVNMYVSLHRGPTEAQLAGMRSANMPVICSQNDLGLRNKDEKLIVGWMHGDEPDNAKSLQKYWKNDIARLKREWPQLKDTKIRWAVPVPPKRIQDGYSRIQGRDPTRPVLLNLGRGVAHEGYIGRGHRTGKLEDYTEYVKGCDIVCFDIYPVAFTKEPAVKGKLWYVPKGVMRLRKWTRDEKIVWNCVEASNGVIGADGKPDPSIVKTEVWMSIIHGSRGIIYFVHQFKPRFIEASVFTHPRMAAGFAAINKQIASLAPVINSPTVTGGASAQSSVPASSELAAAGLEPIAVLVKKHEGATYLFSVRMEGSPAKATFRVQGLPPAARAEVLGESRRLKVTGGKFEDAFEGYGVHLYRISPAP